VTSILALRVIATCALGCGSEDATGVEAPEATSAQDPAVAKMRRLFEQGRVSSVGSFGSTSATGMKTTWSNCVERSARRNDVSTSSVTYAFAGDGNDVVNTGSGFGKVFLQDATQGNDDNRPEALGYPSGVAVTEHVTLDVVRIARNGDLVIERILKPATEESAPALVTTAATEYEQSVYADPRAFATAYVQCPSADRTTEGDGTTGVFIFDDCKDPEFTTASGWRDDRSGRDACTEGGQITLDGRPLPIHIEVEADAGSDVTIRYEGLTVQLVRGAGNSLFGVRDEITFMRGSSTLSATTVAAGTKSLRVDIFETGLEVFADGNAAGTIPAGAEEITGSKTLYVGPKRGSLSGIKIW
jgi:hypothetical protein